MNDRYHFYKRVLEECFQEGHVIRRVSPVTGGCINNGVQVVSDRGDFFVKWQQKLPADMFAAERRGLKLLGETGEIRVPETFGHGKIGDRDFLVMEMIHRGTPVPDYWESFGRALAEMHRHSQEAYGLSHNNYIGKLPQYNPWTEDWIDFFIRKRLEVQLQLALDHKRVDNAFATRLRNAYKNLPDLLPQKKPSLLHGDLWSGNVLTGENGKVCLIDPAVYYGHREMELAFTRLFGGFDAVFYAAYEEAWPLLPGFSERVDIYNLYPLMVHVNLFGTSYLNGVEATIRKLQ